MELKGIDYLIQRAGNCELVVMLFLFKVKMELVQKKRRMKPQPLKPSQ